MKIVEGLVFVALGAGASWLMRPTPSSPTPTATLRHEDVTEPVKRSPAVYVATHEAPRLVVEHKPLEPDRATAIVRDATARHEWTAADREALHAEIDGLPGDVQAELIAQLAAAVNRGDVRVTMDDPPF